MKKTGNKRYRIAKVGVWPFQKSVYVLQYEYVTYDIIYQDPYCGPEYTIWRDAEPEFIEVEP